MNEIQLPVNVEAEHAVLGSILISPKALDEVSEILTGTDFHVPNHQTIYEAIRRLRDNEEPVDVVTVTDELLRMKALQAGLDTAFVHELTSKVATASNAPYYAAIVREQSLRRQVLDAATKAAHIAVDPSIDAETLAEVAREGFDGVGTRTTKRGVPVLGDWIDDYLGSLNSKPSYQPSPWRDLNDLINGFRNGGLYAIGARPAVGKSIVAAQIALHLAKERPVLFVSMEMPREEIAARLFAQTGQVALESLNKHEIFDSQWNALAAARAKLIELPFTIVGSEEVSTIPAMRAVVREMRRKHGRNPAVFIDYLQLFESVGPVESRQVAVAGFSRALKRAAQQWEVPIVALSQLNRGSANRKKNEPTLSDLRESGAIEQDADCVILLNENPRPGYAEGLDFIVAKNRQGRTGTASLLRQGQFARIVQKDGWSEQLDFNNGKAA